VAELVMPRPVVPDAETVIPFLAVVIQALNKTLAPHFVNVDLGQECAACVDPVDTAETADTIAGVFSTHMFNATVRTVLFTGTRPAVGDTVVIDSTTYRITRTSTDEADAAMELTVQELTA
jgi:hypothetical protein